MGQSASSASNTSQKESNRKPLESAGEAQLDLKPGMDNESRNFDAPKGDLAFSPTRTHRGLENSTGSNNCFLNVTIQALWHLGPFRIELQRLMANIVSGKEKDLGRGALLTALCDLFVQYEFTELTVLPPTELRISLSALSDKFRLGEIADANEALDTILHQIHKECEPPCPGPPKCLAHHVFGGLLMEQSVCPTCRASSEPSLRSDFVHCVYAAELIELANQTEKLPFGKLLHQCLRLAPRGCPSNDESQPADGGRRRPPCLGEARVNTYSLEPPLALAITVGWTQNKESGYVLEQFLSLLSYTVRLSDMFTVTNQFSGGERETKNSGGGDNKEKDSRRNNDPRGPTYVFRGFVCYYGLHYVSIFQEYSPGAAKFLLFDDQRIRPLGGWDDVKAECVRSCYQPVLLLYELEKPDATVDTITAPSSSSFSSAHRTTAAASFAAAGEKTKMMSSSSSPGSSSSNAGAAAKSTTITGSGGSKADRPPPYRVTAGELDSLLGSPISPHAEYLSASSGELAPHLRRSSFLVLGNDVLRPDEIQLHMMRADSKIGEYKEGAAGSSSRKPSWSLFSQISGSPGAGTGPSSSSGQQQHPEVINWGRRPIVYRAALFFEKIRPTDRGPGVLGLDTGYDENGHLIIAGFYRHPVTGAFLPAERSGRILLMDRLLAIDNTATDTFSTDEVSAFLARAEAPAVVLTLRSAFLTNLWYLCPNCSIEVSITTEEEVVLKKVSESSNSLQLPVLLNCPTCFLPCRASKSLFI